MTAPVLGVEKSFKGQSWLSRLENDAPALQLAQQFGLPEVMGRVLAARDVRVETAENFLDPSLKRNLQNPSSLKDLDAAVERIFQSLEAGDKIAVFGDYDVDGATSSALLKRYFAGIGVDLRVYIPDRQKEGYGPNKTAFETLYNEGARLVITVDCGAMAFEALAAAKELGLEVIVADHHQMTHEVPPAAAVINPNRPDDTSGLGQLAAVGVTFYLLIGLNRKLRESGYFGKRGLDEPDLMSLLDLVALGTVCDVVPLTGINRALVTQGLKVMKTRGNAGIAALCDIARVNEAPGTYHAGFVIGPRINAGGRVGRSDLGTRLLTASDGSEVQGIAFELDRLNTERKEIESAVQASAMGQAERQMAEGDVPVLVVAGEGWHPGVIGIVASRVKDQFRRPTFVIAIEEGGLAKGSGRSLPGVDLGAAVTDAVEAGVLVNGGGHKMAAGLTVEASKIDELRAFLARALEPQVSRANAARGLKLDGVLSPSGATRDLVDLLSKAGPFGSGNPEPRFALAGAQVVRADIVGDTHIRCILKGPGQGRLKAIAFRALDEPLGAALMAGDGRKLHLAGRLQADNWQGRKDVQFVIEDGAWA